ncbi:MAG: hypothetical protein M3081_15740 [Gemmatimonadota bacterium]|nr:hypothetical protein [Gemmatimonadota bacterium]
MPLEIQPDAPTLLVRREAWEKAGLQRASFDARYNLTPDEFRVESGVVVIGPLFGEGATTDLIAELESVGLIYYDDFFELTGNWPAEWLRLFAMGPSDVSEASSSLAPPRPG